MSNIKKSGLGDAPSFSAKFITGRSTTPQVSAIMADEISQARRVVLSSEVDQGYFRDGSGPSYNQVAGQMGMDMTETANGRIVSSAHVQPSIISKYAQSVGGSANMFRGTHGDTVKQTPEVYSPLWLNSNLNLP